MAKGSIAVAATKEEKLAGSIFMNLANKKGKKVAKKNQTDKTEGQIDFAIVKKFNNLKLSVPMKEEDYEKTMKDLDELKDALIYWGKIIQRLSKIKYIRSSRKISSDQTYIDMAEEEEKYIETEKAKYSGEDASNQELNAEKLKIAQVIDRESRLKKAWDDGDDSEEEEGEKDNAFESDEDKKRRQKPEAEKQKGGR